MPTNNLLLISFVTSALELEKYIIRATPKIGIIDIKFGCPSLSSKKKKDENIKINPKVKEKLLFKLDTLFVLYFSKKYIDVPTKSSQILEINK